MGSYAQTKVAELTPTMGAHPRSYDFGHFHSWLVAFNNFWMVHDSEWLIMMVNNLVAGLICIFLNDFGVVD